MRATLAVCLLLGACAAGPDFERPKPLVSGDYLEAALPAQTSSTAVEHGGQSQTLRAGNDLSNQWWMLFRSQPLNELVTLALRENGSLAIASARLREAQETLAAGRGALFPEVNAQVGAARERVSGVTLGLPGTLPPFNYYNAQLGLNYTFDLFGGVRRQLEALSAQVDYQENELRATQLLITADLVTAVVRDAQLREQVQALHDVEKLQRDGVRIVERRFELGAVTKTDVLAQRTALAQTIAQISPLERQQAQTRHLIALLVGRTPSETDLAMVEAVPLELPTDIPVSVASDLVRQRPDILASEALLHAASAQVGVATANLYPQITLGGNWGSTALTTGDLFKPASMVWGISAGVVQPVFHGGTLLAQRRAAVAAFDGAAAAYRETVLAAFSNVADSLQALRFDATALAAQEDALEQAKSGAEMAQRQFDFGAASYLSLLNAQTQYREAVVAQAQARADRFADTVALFQALGGGWWNAQSKNADAPRADSGLGSLGDARR